MTVSVHVDPCPTCHGVAAVVWHPGWSRCPDCPIVPGYRVPDPWFVVVPHDPAAEETTVEIVEPMTRKNITLSRDNHIIDGETTVSMRSPIAAEEPTP